MNPKDEATSWDKAWLTEVMGTNEAKEFEKYLLGDDVAEWWNSFKVYDAGRHDEKERFTGLLTLRQLDLWVRFLEMYSWKGLLDDDPEHQRKSFGDYGSICSSGIHKVNDRNWPEVEKLLSEYGTRIPEHDQEDWKAAVNELVAAKSMDSSARYSWLTGQSADWLKREGLYPERDRPTVLQLCLLAMFFEGYGFVKER